MTALGEPLTLHQLGPVSFLCGIALFGVLMFVNALSDTAHTLARRRPRLTVSPSPELLPPPYVPHATRVLPVPPWERRPAGRMPRVAWQALPCGPLT